MNRLVRLSSLTLFTLWMAARVPASAAELPTSTPEAEGMSAEKLAKVGEIMNGFIKDKKIAGGIVLVARNGKLVFQETYGLRNLDGKLPVERDTIFRIYSMSKAITSAAALMLVDEGKLDLDAPVAKYLPEFAEMKVVDGENGAAGEVADHRERLVPAHVGYHVRQRGRQPDGKTVRSDRCARHAIRPRADVDEAQPNPARIRSGHEMEIRGVDRRARLPGAKSLGAAAGGVSQGADLRAARDDRHGLLRAGGRSRRGLRRTTIPTARDG